MADASDSEREVQEDVMNVCVTILSPIHHNEEPEKSGGAATGTPRLLTGTARRVFLEVYLLAIDTWEPLQDAHCRRGQVPHGFV